MPERDAMDRVLASIKAEALRDALDTLRRECQEDGMSPFVSGIAYSISRLETWAKEYEYEDE